MRMLLRYTLVTNYRLLEHTFSAYVFFAFETYLSCFVLYNIRSGRFPVYTNPNLYLRHFLVYLLCFDDTLQ